MNATAASGHELRPLGAFERIIDLYIHRNPVQFSLAVECGRVLREREVDEALRRLQKVHPLLASMIDRSGSRPLFRFSNNAIPLRTASASTWHAQAAIEQTRPIPPSPGPLARAVLVPDAPSPGRTTIVLTFSHQIADGRGALGAAHDLLAILDGHDIRTREVPICQEDLMQLVEPEPIPSVQDEVPGSEYMVQTAPASLRPFDETAPPVVGHAELDEVSVDRIRRSAHLHSCTVQSMLCAAAATSLFEASNRDRVRINVPIDLRGAAGLEDDVVIRFTATSVVLSRPSRTAFWELAHAATTQLATARTLEATRRSVLALAALNPVDSGGAEQAMLAATNADIEITNLGVSSGIGTDASAQAIWGPVMSTQVENELILGVVTHGDRLRMTMTSQGSVSGLLSGIVAQLTAATS
ncbi:hypothetical protein [Rhodococcus sp. NPDC076796]|uniref:hypothetical protein n=1 Tax=Rhodococcus sp. NPDC076796 TaxID=3154859 RepID=UPI00344D869F